MKGYVVITRGADVWPTRQSELGTIDPQCKKMFPVSPKNTIGASNLQCPKKADRRINFDNRTVALHIVGNRHSRATPQGKRVSDILSGGHRLLHQVGRS